MHKFIVVDYQEGAGGEFIARFISAHLGHNLEWDQQSNPDHTQKYLNSHSLVEPNWNKNFANYLSKYIDFCTQQGIENIAVPYHLYKWPHHVHTIRQQIPQVRFVRISCHDAIQQVNAEFRRKVLDRRITDFNELQFLLSNKDRNRVKTLLKLFQQKQLFYKDIDQNFTTELQILPSNDIEIFYTHFFINFEQTDNAYSKLCIELGLTPNELLLSTLLKRNKKNLQDLNLYLNTHEIPSHNLL